MPTYNHITERDFTCLNGLSRIVSAAETIANVASRHTAARCDSYLERARNEYFAAREKIIDRIAREKLPKFQADFDNEKSQRGVTEIWEAFVSEVAYTIQECEKAAGYETAFADCDSEALQLCQKIFNFGD